MKKHLRTIFANVVVFAVIMEGISFIYSWMPPSKLFYSNEREILERVTASSADYQKFLRTTYDGTLGWTTPQSKTVSRHTCRGKPVEYTYNDLRARVTPDIPDDREILVFGDSYTQSAEVTDSQSYPWKLSNILGRKVVNYGGPGYGPLQATLRFEKVVGHHDKARIAILGIMTENIFRLLNAFRPVYMHDTGAIFGFKPFIRDGVIRPNPNFPPAKSAKDLQPLIQQAYRTDYFSRPSPKFPYFPNLIRGVFSKPAQMLLATKLDYPAILKREEFRRGVDKVTERFIEIAEKRGIYPIILWIPQYPSHRHGLAEITKDFGRRFGGRATFVAVDDDSYDWGRYNSENSGCHPSPYGYSIIAGHAAAAVKAVEKRLIADARK